MAVEIKELVIRAVIDYRQEDEKNSPGTAQNSLVEEREAIVRACVRQVLRIINRSKQR